MTFWIRIKGACLVKAWGDRTLAGMKDDICPFRNSIFDLNWKENLNFLCFRDSVRSLYFPQNIGIYSASLILCIDHIRDNRGRLRVDLNFFILLCFRWGISCFIILKCHCRYRAPLDFEFHIQIALLFQDLECLQWCVKNRPNMEEDILLSNHANLLHLRELPALRNYDTSGSFFSFIFLAPKKPWRLHFWFIYVSTSPLTSVCFWFYELTSNFLFISIYDSRSLRYSAKFCQSRFSLF